tara:strand:- start:13979 stop:14767 length:789 start_codon:yes stop_codon:yes gene_type:complete
MNTNTFYQSLERFVRDKLRNVHTIKPAVVTKNNGHTVNVKVLSTTRYRDGTQLPLPILEDVPLMIYSGTKGNARVTVPVIEGDTVLLLCSDRDFSDLLDSPVDTDSIFPSDSIEPFGIHPIMAIPMFFTEPEGKPIDTKNIVVENGTTTITVKPSGDIDIDTPANINVNAGGNASVSVGGSADISVGGSTTLSTASLTVDALTSTFTGNVAIAGNLTTAGTAAITGALTAATVDGSNVSLENHTHPYTWTDPAGSGNTSPPN